MSSRSTPGIPHQVVAQTDPNGNHRPAGAGGGLRRREVENLILSSFAALLSSAQTNGIDHATAGKGNSSLSQFLSNKVDFDPTNPQAPNCISLPSLSLHNNVRKFAMEMSLQDVASLNLAIPICVSREEVQFLPTRLLKNFSKSFMSLIDSRHRSSAMALIRQINKLGSANASVETSVLVQLLRERPIAITTVVTSFRVLNNGIDGTTHPHPSGHGETRMLPLVFEAVVDAKILGTMVTVPIQSPGTITVGFHSADGLIDRIEISFDTIALLQGMMKQARSIVKKAVKCAAAIAGTIRAKAATNQPAPQMPKSGLSGLPLASCSSLADVQSTQENVPKVNQVFPQHPFHEAKQQINPLFLPNITETASSNMPGMNQFLQPTILAKPTASQEQITTAQTLQPIKEETSSSSSTPKKIELFSWLKGDGMLLPEGNDTQPNANDATLSSQDSKGPTTAEDDGMAFLKNKNWVPTAYGGVNGVLQSPKRDITTSENESSETNNSPRPMKKRRVSFQSMKYAV